MTRIRERWPIVAVFAIISMVAFSLWASLARPQNSSAQTYKIVGYVTSWGGRADEVQYSKLTHINYAFALPTASGGVTFDGGTKLTDVVNRAHAAGVKVLISVGGWNDGNDSGFEAIAANGLENTFATNLANLMNQYNLDGIDIDWEYPEAGDRYTEMLRAIRNRIGTGKLLTAAVAGTGGDGVPASAIEIMDFINLMVYDGDGGAGHSPYSYAVSSFNYWAPKTSPKSKLILGVPFYARPSWKAYSTLVNEGCSPDADTCGGDHYNGRPTMRDKVKLVKDQGGGGIMYWEDSQDFHGSDARSLLTTIYDALNTGTNPATATRTRTNTTGTNPPTATHTRTNTTGTGAGCWTPWSSSQVYTNGMQASDNGRNYQANWWNQGDRPSTSTSGAWADKGACGGTTPPTATRTRTNTTGTTPPTATRTRTRTNTSGTNPPTATRTRTNTTGTTPPTATRTRTNTTGTGYPAWAPNVSYAVGATVSYQGVNYRCAQGHTSQTGWEPPNVPALWTRL